MRSALIGCVQLADLFKAHVYGKKIASQLGSGGPGGQLPQIKIRGLSEAEVLSVLQQLGERTLDDFHMQPLRFAGAGRPLRRCISFQAFCAHRRATTEHFLREGTPPWLTHWVIGHHHPTSTLRRSVSAAR